MLPFLSIAAAMFRACYPGFAAAIFRYVSSTIDKKRNQGKQRASKHNPSTPGACTQASKQSHHWPPGFTNKAQPINACTLFTLDPSTIENLMRLFELESYKAWAAMELEQEKKVAAAEESMKEADDYLDSAMESAMEEFRLFEEEMERESNKELQGLLLIGESARRLGKSMEKEETYEKSELPWRKSTKDMFVDFGHNALVQ